MPTNVQPLSTHPAHYDLGDPSWEAHQPVEVLSHVAPDGFEVTLDLQAVGHPLEGNHGNGQVA